MGARVTRRLFQLDPLSRIAREHPWHGEDEEKNNNNRRRRREEAERGRGSLRTRGARHNWRAFGAPGRQQLGGHLLLKRPRGCIRGQQRGQRKDGKGERSSGKKKAEKRSQRWVSWAKSSFCFLSLFGSSTLSVRGVVAHLPNNLAFSANCFREFSIVFA